MTSLSQKNISKLALMYNGQIATKIWILGLDGKCKKDLCDGVQITRKEICIKVIKM